jgi:anti-sigma regulatory factor (Ser/Thr protein kinase)
MCSFWRASEACDAAVLTVSELVGNSVRAAVGTEVKLRLAWTPRRLRVEVIDAAPGVPALRHAADTDEGGRGLFLISQLAVRWGVEPRGPGKCVWAEIALPVAA